MDRLSRANETRESWCILTLDVELTESTPFLSHWELAIANIDQFLETEEGTSDSVADEPNVLKALAAALDKFRFEGIVLITPSQQTLSVLRSRLLASEAISHPTLRGFRHVGVGELLQRHFHISGIEEQFEVDSITGRNIDSQLVHSEPSARKVWEVLADMAPLVPPSQLQGEPL